MWRSKIQNNFKYNTYYKINTFSNKIVKGNQNQDTYINIKQSLVSNIKVGFEHIKGTLIEVMAKRMNENDIVKMKNYWSNTIETNNDSSYEINLNKIEEHQFHKEKDSALHLQSKCIKDIPLIISKDPKHIDIFDKLRNDLNTVNEDVYLYHPLLGEKIADLGYKKLFLTNIKSLILTPIWKKQRILRPERAALIAKEKIKNGLASSLNGSIVLYMHRKSNEIGIIDGQHRAAALMILSQQGYWDESNRNVLLEVFTVDSISQITSLFREINSAEPVRLIDMLEHESDDKINSTSSIDSNNSSSNSSSTISDNNTNQIPPLHQSVEYINISNQKDDQVNNDNREAVKHKSYSDTNKKKIPPLLRHQDYVMIINETVDLLSTTYPDMFKPSSRCKSPHMNIDVLRDELFRSEYIQKHEITSSESLISKLLETNQSEKIAATSTASVTTLTSSKSYHTALEKAIEHDFYLGLDKGWIYR